MEMLCVPTFVFGPHSLSSCYSALHNGGIVNEEWSTKLGEPVNMHSWTSSSLKLPLPVRREGGGRVSEQLAERIGGFVVCIPVLA